MQNKKCHLKELRENIRIYTAMKRTRIINILFFILFILILLIQLIVINTNEVPASNTDGKNIAPKPVIGTEDYTQKIEAWMCDRLRSNDEISASYEVLNEVVFGELINPMYQFGRSGYTFFKMHNNIEYSDYHKKFAEMVYNMQTYCESRGTRFYYVFNPEKESMLRNYLPAGVNYNDRWVDSMLSYMDEIGVNYIDLRDALEEKENSKKVFDKKNDPGHWNHIGAFYGMREISKRIHNDNLQVKVLEENEYNIIPVVTEKLYGSGHLINEERKEYKLKADYKDITGELSSELQKSARYGFIQLVRNDSVNASGIQMLMAFEDDLYAPFAVSRSKETALISGPQNAVNFDYYYNIFNPDVMIFETMEYVVEESYFSQPDMEAAEYNPAILANFPAEDFQERRDKLLSETVEGHVDASAVVIPGKAVDRIYLSSGLEAAKYAYLITDNKVVDLKRNKQKALEASVMHQDLSVGSEATLFIIKENGDCRYAVVPVLDNKKNIANGETSSDNAQYNKGMQQYIMTNQVEGDAFAYAAMQLYDEDMSKWLETIASTFETGIVDGSYCHMMPTGTYTFLLRAGSSVTSEWKAFRVHLVEGHSYWFSYKVDVFSDDKVIFSGFEFLKERKQ